MAYMKQNVNFVLLFLIILASITIVGATIYYQITLHGLSTKYHNSLNAIDKLNDTLHTKIESLEDISGELELKAKRETELSSQFTTVKGTAEALEQQVDDLENDLDAVNLELSSKIKEVSNLKKDLQEKDEHYQSIIDGLEDEIDELKEELEEAQG